MSRDLDPSRFDDLPVDEKIDLVQELWDRIAASPDDVPVPDWHLETVRERLAAHRRAPEQTVSWDDVRRELEALLQGRRV
jgi:putative addiction module component (TIGR02574 family)